MSYISSIRTRLLNMPKLSLALLVALIWLLLAAITWWYVVYQSPRNVFEGMLSNNFSTAGYTRHIDSTQNGVKANESTQLVLGKDPFVRTLTVLQQGNDKVTTEAINTQDQDYVRYVSITTSRKDSKGKKLDFSKAINVWAKSPVQNGNSQAVNQAILGVFPVGNLPAQKRNDLLKYISDEKAFSVRYDNVKTEKINGRKVYTYTVQLLPQPYVTMLKSFGQAAGIGDQVATLNPRDYSGASPTNMKVSIDVTSHHLVKVVMNEGAERTEQYDAYGLRYDLMPPKAAISTSELQQRLTVQ